MKVQIEESTEYTDTEIIIRCREVNDHVAKIVSLVRSYDKKITGTADGDTHILDIESILYIDTVDKKTFLYLENQVYETSFKLYELEERLGGSDFFRASKSAIINFNQIVSLRPDFGGRMLVQMSNGEKLNVSRQFVPTIKKKLGI